MDSRGTTCVTMDSDRYSLRGKRMMKLLPFFESETQLKIDPLNEAFTNAKVEEACPPSQLSAEHVEMLESIVSEFSRSTEDRIRHGTGHCQEDIFLIRGGRSMRVPDAVVWPGSEEDILAVVSEARKNGWCLIPFGGGTNVSQATRCPPIDVEPRPIISVDMRKLNKILWIDEENGLAHVQSGITGLALEEELAACGYTTGHEPDSLEFSTLGGWIATKASGMKRNKYGNIEDIVKSVRVVGPDGLLRHGREDSRACGRESCGVDLRSLMLGSEGCLGVITSAVIRIWPIPEAKDYDSVLLPSLHEGLSFVRAISRQGSRIPASVRLLDNEHFRLGLALKPDTDSLLAVFKKVLSNLYLQWRVDFNPKQVVCATFAYEGSPEEVKEQKRLVGRLLSHHGGISLGSEVGRATYDMTFMIAYLRDFAMTYHFLGESFETFAPWSQVETIIHATRERICKEHEARFLPGKPFVGCRVTQLYHEGACLYFYFCMNFENVSSASSVFSEIERAARAEILSHGGSLSHHHGVGKVRSSFLGEIDSDAHQRVMQSLKRGIDPENIFGARNGTFGRKGTLR
jgi:alkyldihydroxyacetonephosphate synthase